MRFLAAALSCFAACSCAAPPDVKQASAQVVVGLDKLQEARRDFENAYLDALEEGKKVAARAIVARAVVRKVNQLSKAEAGGNLIEISRAIRTERETFQKLLALVVKEKLQEDEDPAAAVRRIGNKAAALRATAKALEAAGKTESAKKLEKEADEWEAGAALDDRDRSDIRNIFLLTRTQQELRRGLKDLKSYITFLQLVHQQVHEWVMTDVKASGADIAKLIDEHAGLLGLRDGGSP